MGLPMEITEGEAGRAVEPHSLTGYGLGGGVPAAVLGQTWQDFSPI